MLYETLVALILTVGMIILLTGSVVGIFSIATNNPLMGLLSLTLIGIGWTILDPDGTVNLIKKWIVGTINPRA